jgi:asparagine synthase (glutamine-hydrolysing)
LSFAVDTHHTEAYFLDSLLIALQDSVKLQLRSDVAVGAYLSGGLDSSAITALAAEYAGGNFHCFTGRFSESDQYDETAYAGLVATEKAAELHFVTPTPEDFVAWMPRIIWHMDEPVAGPGVFPQFMVSSAAKERVTVALGGQGGDEVFGGYARYLVAYLEQALKGAVFATKTEGQFVVTLESIIPNLPALRQYVPMLQSLWREELFEPLPQRYFRLLDRSPDLFGLLSETRRHEFSRRRVAESFHLVFDKPDIASSINKMLAFDIEVVLPALLQVEDRASMQASLESRVPLLAPKIMRLAASIPPTIKFKNGQLKYALKEAVRSFLPEAVLKRKDKMGFPVPLAEWLRQGPVREFAADLLLSRTCRERAIFDVKALEEMMNKEVPHSRQVWGALCLELWFRTFIDGGNFSEPSHAR